MAVAALLWCASASIWPTKRCHGVRVHPFSHRSIVMVCEWKHTVMAALGWLSRANILRWQGQIFVKDAGKLLFPIVVQISDRTNRGKMAFVFSPIVHNLRGCLVPTAENCDNADSSAIPHSRDSDFAHSQDLCFAFSCKNEYCRQSCSPAFKSVMFCSMHNDES